MKHSEEESLVTRVSIGTVMSFVVPLIMGNTLFESVVIVSVAVVSVDTTVSVGDDVSMIPVAAVVVLAVNTKFLGAAANLVVMFAICLDLIRCYFPDCMDTL